MSRYGGSTECKYGMDMRGGQMTASNNPRTVKTLDDIVQEYVCEHCPIMGGDCDGKAIGCYHGKSSMLTEIRALVAECVPKEQIARGTSSTETLALIESFNDCRKMMLMAMVNRGLGEVK